MKYKVEVTETLKKIIEVEALDEDEALYIVEKMYKKDLFELNELNFLGAEFDIIE